MLNERQSTLRPFLTTEPKGGLQWQDTLEWVCRCQTSVHGYDVIWWHAADVRELFVWSTGVFGLSSQNVHPGVMESESSVWQLSMSEVHAKHVSQIYHLDAKVVVFGVAGIQAFVYLKMCKMRAYDRK